MQKVKIINVNPLHSANVAGLLYVVIGILYAIGFFFLAPLDPETAGLNMNWRIIISLVMLVLMPALGWVSVFIMTWFGNLFLKIAGGIEITLKNK